MTISLEELADDPSLYLLAVDQRAAHFQRMSRSDFHRSIFLDNRMVGAADSRFHVPIDVVRQRQWPDPKSRPIGMIFHVAHCGSTLLARALDLPGRSLVLREPTALRRLGIEAGSGGGADPELLRFVLAMLGKRWNSDQPVIAKLNVPVNFIAEQILKAEEGTPAILLHFPLSSYIAAVMRTEAHEKWVETVFADLALAESQWASVAPPANTAQRAACLWFAQMHIFAGLTASFPEVRSLGAHLLFEEPARTVHEAGSIFHLQISEEEAAEIAASDLFATYSKNPALDYDLEVRAAREQEAKRRLAAQIDEARTWCAKADKLLPLPKALDRPLFGGPVHLLA